MWLLQHIKWKTIIEQKYLGTLNSREGVGGNGATSVVYREIVQKLQMLQVGYLYEAYKGLSVSPCSCMRGAECASQYTLLGIYGEDRFNFLHETYL